MKRLLLSSVVAACTFFAGVDVSFAQDEAVPQFQPVEM
jgi:hypothetical protein